MSKLRIIVVGKIKEAFTRDWISEYAKRLGKYCRLDVTELKEGRTTADEAAQILKYTHPPEYIIALTSTGILPTSEDFARKLRSELLHRDVTFVIGSDKGLEHTVLKRADLQLSFGRMTYSHQLARVILYEQIYRAFTIMKGEPYHRISQYPRFAKLGFKKFWKKPHQNS